MNRITLNNNIQMPMLGFGTFLMGGSECEESVLAAIRSGYRMIDTAEAYGNEKAVGNAIMKSGIPREELFLVTKVNFRSYENTRETVEASLNKLKTSYLDLVLLHWPFGNYYAAWRELEKMYHEGKIRAIGVSNFDPGRLIDLIEFNEVVPAVNQIETHLLCQRRAEHEWLEKYHVQHMAYAPLGQGRKNEMFENPDLVEIAKTHGKTAAQIALRYLMQSGVIVIPKSVHTERIKENFELFDFALTAGEMERLVNMDTATPNGAFFTPDGRVTDDLPLRGEIYEELKCCAVNNIPRKITNILEVMKLAAHVEDFAPETDKIHLANGTLTLDGNFTEGRPDIVRSRLPVAYRPDAPAPVRWLSFLDGLLYTEDIPTLQEFIGYSLIPSNKGQRMMVMKGNGGE